MKGLFKLLTVFISIISFGQSFEKNYLGRDFRDYQGAKFKFEEETYVSKLRNSFYLDIEEAKEYMGQSSLFTNDDKEVQLQQLKKIVFTVMAFYNQSGETLADGVFDLRPILQLEGNDLNTYYFAYDARKEMYFPFLVSLNIEGIDFCSKINQKKDDLTGKTAWSSPTNKNDIYGPSVLLIENDGKKDIYLSLSTIGSTLNVKEKGVIILFEDGTKIERPNAQIETDVAKNNDWRYSTFLTLSEEELDIISTKRMTKFRLYIYDGNVNGSEQFMNFSRCIKQKFNN